MESSSAVPAMGTTVTWSTRCDSACPWGIR